MFSHSSELFLVAGLMDQFVTELRNGVTEVADIVSGNLLQENRELCVTRLEVMAESALSHESISPLTHPHHRSIPYIKKVCGEY